MGQAQINVRTRACSRTSIARTRQAALTHNVRGKELNKLHFRLHSQCKRRLTCCLNRIESTNQTRLPAVARTHCDVFQAGLPWQGIAKLYKGSIFCHHRDTICRPKSGYVTTSSSIIAVLAHLCGSGPLVRFWPTCAVLGRFWAGSGPLVVWGLPALRADPPHPPGRVWRTCT